MEVEVLFQEHKYKLGKRVDRGFAYLMVLQWVLAILLAVFVSPLTWSGDSSSIHMHVWMAIFLGGIFTSLPVYYAIFNPGQKIGRYVIAIAQMGFSTLFIHLMGGRIEAHFHIFGSLAFLSAYREWRLLILPSLLAIADHLIRGIYFPLSVYGVMSGVEWRWLEHAGWILFEDLFLGYMCVQATREMRQIAVTKSDLIKARINAEKLNAGRSHFFSVVSHEIRTPLNGIIGFTDFLQESPIPAEQRDYVNIIKQCSDTLLKVVNDLLDFHKLDSGRLELDPHAFKISDVQQYLENVFSLECQKKNLTFSMRVASEVPVELYGDSHRIRQVLTNIIGNAVKFTDEGSIQVSVSHYKGNLYRWDIADTGIGIKKDNLQKIFSPYTQEFSSTARKYGGSGLGLSISKTLVELMGGQLHVESTYGKGSVFFFTLPLK
ncbi:sensor histidine kinase [Bdellovibrio sp. HCB337]|uniref:sensor histidine kinase n=1 Tax=Bdellovibrio sp. HCB337 TaxID=3394358 RepID=UPI0039A599FC